MRPIAFRRGSCIAVLCGLLSMGAVEASAQSQASPEMKAQAKALARTCRADFRKHCRDVQRGEGRVLACLESHASELAPKCRDALSAARDKAGSSPQ